MLRAIWSNNLQSEINGYFLGDTDAGEWTLSPP